MRESRSRARYASLAIVGFVMANHLNYVVKALGLVRSLPWLIVLGIRNAMEVALCLVGVSVANRSGLKNAARELGLFGPVPRALGFAFLASLPMLIAFAATSKVSSTMTWLTVGVGCFIAPFAEEVLFRAYLFRQLYRRARLGFWPSALIPSALFALVHVYQASSLPALLGIVAVTGLGGLGFCWLFTRWQDNLWVVFAVHSAMNLWWEVFAVDDTALGGWLANGARLLTVALAIVLTIYKDRIWKPLESERQNVAYLAEPEGVGDGAARLQAGSSPWRAGRAGSSGPFAPWVTVSTRPA